MQRDPQAPDMRDELDLVGTDHSEPAEQEKGSATQFDYGGDDDDDAACGQENEARDGTTDEELPTETRQDREQQPQATAIAASDYDEEEQMPRWLQALPCGGLLYQALAPIRRFVKQPLGMLAAAIGVLFIAVGFYPSSEPSKPAPPPVANSAVFPVTDFRSADRGAITESQARAVLAHYAKKGSPATTARVEQTSTDDGYGAKLDATVLQVARDSRVSETAHQTNETRKRRPTRRRSSSTKPGGAPRAVSSRKSAQEWSEPIPAYFISAGDDDEDEPEKKEEQLQLAVGTRIEVTLDLGISSARHGTVVARTTERIIDAAGVVIPGGAVVTGRSSSGHKRIYVDITGIRIGTRLYSAQGVATRGNEVGIEAAKVETSFDERTSARVADGALGALRSLAVAAAGSAGRVLSQTAGGAIEEAQQEQRIDRTFTLSVPAGTVFTVVITG